MRFPPWAATMFWTSFLLTVVGLVLYRGITGRPHPVVAAITAWINQRTGGG